MTKECSCAAIRGIAVQQALISLEGKSIEIIALPQFSRRLIKLSCKGSKDYKC